MASPSDPTDIVWAGVTIDCRAAEQTAGFWRHCSTCQVGLLARAGGAGIASVLVPGGPVLNFQPVGWAKVGKVPIHLDLPALSSDEVRHAQASDLEVLDIVLLIQERTRLLTPRRTWRWRMRFER